MSATANTTIEVPDVYAKRLEDLAEQKGVSESHLVTKALDILFSLAESPPEDDHRDWQSMGMARFEQDWEYEEDAVYDDWRTHYGVARGLCVGAVPVQRPERRQGSACSDSRQGRIPGRGTRNLGRLSNLPTIRRRSGPGCCSQGLGGLRPPQALCLQASDRRD